MQRILRPGVALLCLALAACGTDLKETLGLNHTGPDAFQVYSRPPLTVPPEFSLLPPGKGPEYSVSQSADVQAHNEVLGAGANKAGAAAAASPGVNLLNSPTTGPAATAVPAVTASALPTNADAQFLSDIGAAKADPHIREELDKDKENGAAPKSDKYLLGGKASGDPVVDAGQEAARLKQDKAQGQPPTTGDTPVITPPDKGILGDIF